MYIYTYFIVPTFVNEIYMPTFEQQLLLLDLIRWAE